MVLAPCRVPLILCLTHAHHTTSPSLVLWRHNTIGMGVFVSFVPVCSRLMMFPAAYSRSYLLNIPAAGQAVLSFHFCLRVCGDGNSARANVNAAADILRLLRLACARAARTSPYVFENSILLTRAAGCGIPTFSCARLLPHLLGGAAGGWGDLISIQLSQKLSAMTIRAFRATHHLLPTPGAYRCCCSTGAGLVSVYGTVHGLVWASPLMVISRGGMWTAWCFFLAVVGRFASCHTAACYTPHLFGKGGFCRVSVARSISVLQDVWSLRTRVGFTLLLRYLLFCRLFSPHRGFLLRTKREDLHAPLLKAARRRN